MTREHDYIIAKKIHKLNDLQKEENGVYHGRRKYKYLMTHEVTEDRGNGECRSYRTLVPNYSKSTHQCVSLLDFYDYSSLKRHKVLPGLKRKKWECSINDSKQHHGDNAREAILRAVFTELKLDYEKYC